MNQVPWSLVEQFKKERILTLAKLIIDIRSKVIDRHDPELGDTRLSLGIRAYECCRTNIIKKSEDGAFPWLSVPTPEGRFTFAIDGIPVRFSRNDPDYLPDRKLIHSDEAEAQYELFKTDNQYIPLHWFLIIDTAYDLPAQNFYFVGYSDTNEIISKWEVPIDETLTVLGTVDEQKPQPVEVPPAKGKLKLVPKDIRNQTEDGK